MDPQRAQEAVRLALQVAMHDKRVRTAEADPELKDHLPEAQQMLDAARAAFDAGPELPDTTDPIEAEAQRRYQAEKDKAAIEDRLNELKIADPAIDTSDLERQLALDAATREAAIVESTKDAAGA